MMEVSGNKLLFFPNFKISWVMLYCLGQQQRKVPDTYKIV